MAEQGDTEVVVAAVETQPVSQFIDGKRMPHQADRIVAPRAPGMGVSPVPRLRVQQVIIVRIDEDVHRAAAHAARQHGIAEVHEDVEGQQRAEGDSILPANGGVEHVGNTVDRLPKAVGPGREEAAGDRSAFRADAAVVEVDPVSMIRGVEGWMRAE